MPRKGLNFNWIHAGLFRDVDGNVHDIYYAFMPDSQSKDGEKIHYAIDNTGAESGNWNVGRHKFDLITWDAHHIQLWQQYLTAAGTWVIKDATRGRAYARAQLRDRYHDRRFHDPYPNGKNDSRIMGPPLNVNFKDDDESVPVPPVFRFARQGILAKDKCYPGTNIPLSADGIKIGAWKDEHPRNPSAKRVVGDFLTGLMTRGIFGRFAEVQLDRIESAFFELGYRVNRNALQRANEDMRDRGVTNAFGSRAWRQAPPLKVDRFKGEEIEALMRGMSNDASTAGPGGGGGGGDDDDEDDNEDGGNDGPAGPSGSGWQYGGNGGDSDSDSDSSSDSDDLPAASTNKGKGKGKGKGKCKAVVSRRKPKKSKSCQPTSFECIRGSDDEDEDEKDEDLFVTETRQSSPAAGPSSGRRVVRDRDEELARRLFEEEVEEVEEAALRLEVAQAQLPSDDEYEYLSDGSPDKGKGKATKKPSKTPPKTPSKKRPITTIIEDDSEDDFVIIGPSKRTKTNTPKPKEVISLRDEDEDNSDSDIIIDEDRSCKPYIKDEVIELKDEDSDME